MLSPKEEAQELTGTALPSYNTVIFLYSQIGHQFRIALVKNRSGIIEGFVWSVFSIEVASQLNLLAPTVTRTGGSPALILLFVVTLAA